MLREAPAGLPRQAELAATPFFPQERYQCGPAALAMTLGAAGIDVAPEALVPQVYVPEREGSLPPEMLAAGRRNGAFSMTVPPRLDALLAEVAAGNPVLVLQNLSLPWVPLWHYSVVIGYDLDRTELVLRSGTTARTTMALSTFEHTWARSQSWGMVTLAPGRLPRTAQEAPTVAAAVAFEQANGAAAARRVYAAALERWPQDLALLLGLGNSAYAAGNVAAAVDAFRRAVAAHPDSAPALNDLAFALNAMGRRREARAAAQKALSLGGPWQEAVRDTLRSIDAAPRRR
ncbi:MAG: PA2778 family cysteine peptidase [Rhodocyclaceae bacterium]|nr:PA2778 family cysteine peptidase [Rhodocyclaceae bacterium]